MATTATHMRSGTTQAEPRRSPRDAALVELTERIEHQRGLLRDLWKALRTVLEGICLARAADDLARWARLRVESVALVDIEAEGVVLGDALVRAKLLYLEVEDFAWPHHRALALAIVTGHLADELLAPEARGYRRGLLRACRPIEEVVRAHVRVGDHSRQRRVLRIAEGACAGLRLDGCDFVLTAAELRAAADLLECLDANVDSR
jgi:hypothetical protein